MNIEEMLKGIISTKLDETIKDKTIDQSVFSTLLESASDETKEIINAAIPEMEKAVNCAIADIRYGMIDIAIEALSGLVSSIESEHQNLVVSMVDTAVTKWLDENKVAIVDNAELNKYRAVIGNMRTAFEAQLGALTPMVEPPAVQVNESVDTSVYTDEIASLKKKLAFAEACDGQSELAKEQMLTLAESTEYVDHVAFKNTLLESVKVPTNPNIEIPPRVSDDTPVVDNSDAPLTVYDVMKKFNTKY